MSTNTSIELEFIITNSNYTTLLATAVDTSDNNNITDASTNSHTITVTGDAHAGTFSPYRSGGYSLEFNGSNSRVGIQSSNVQIGTSAFSMEFWLYSRAYSGSISSKYSASTSNGYFMISTTTSDGFRCRTRSAGGTQYYVNSGSGTYNLNEWNHCIFQRDANGNLTSYLNGTKYTGDNDGSTNLSATELALGVFNYTGYEGWLDGYIRDFKLTIGTSALRTASTITVPTEPLASDSNTTAFLGYLPYLADGSNSPNSVVSSNASTSPFSPYDYKEYSATDHGGSVYFDGSGDKLTIGGSVGDFNFGTNSFTIECWAYHQAAAVGPLFNTHRAGTGDGYYIALLSNGGVNWGNYVDGTGDISTSANVITQSTWNHISVNRDSSSSNSLKIYVNGILRYTGTSATDYNTFNYGPFVGGYDAGGVQYDFTGYLSDIIVVNGSVLRTGGTSVGDVAFTPPSTPIATPSNTKLHIKGTDASIIDKSQSTNLQLIGNTTGSTTEVKFADTKSVYFDGTGDYIEVPASSLLDVSSSDITIEGYFYTTTTTTKQGVWEFYSNDNNYVRLFYEGDSGNVFRLTLSDGGTVRLNATGTTNFSADTWHHIAVTRNHSTGEWKTFIDGNQDTGASGTESAAVNTSSWNFLIGVDFVSIDRYWNGYIQDFRFTKGLARYTANFTPPTEPLKG